MEKKPTASYAIFFLLVVVLAISEMVTVKGKLCEKHSITWSGKCSNKKCDLKCISWEKAFHGACHKREGKNQCFCYFDCAKKPPKATPAPPGALPPPPPAAGGGSPPPADGGDGDGGSPPSPPSDGGSPPPPVDGGSSAPPQSETKPCPKIYQKIASLEKA